MKHVPPIYLENGRCLQADTCGPLVDAAGRGRVRLAAVARGSFPGVRLTEGALPGLSSLGYWDAAGRQDWGLDWHRNEGIEVTFLEKGSTGFGVGDREWHLRPDDLTITRPWQLHRVGNPKVGACRLHWLILDVGVRRPNESWRWPEWIVLTREDREELTRALRLNEEPVWRATGQLGECFRKLAGVVDAEPARGLSRMAALVNELLVELLDMLREQRVALDPGLTSSARTVELFLADLGRSPQALAHAWSLPEMAGACGLGTTHFVACCKRLTNLAPMQYLAQTRLERAARLLERDAGVPVGVVARAVGYASARYFATAFRAQFGCAPTAWRASVRGGAGTGVPAVRTEGSASVAHAFEQEPDSGAE